MLSEIIIFVVFIIMFCGVYDYLYGCYFVFVGYIYLYIRMLRVSSLYGVGYDMLKDDLFL